MHCSEFSTTCSPSSAFCRVSEETRCVSEAFRATSRTVAFISFMAVAASVRRWAASDECLSDCSILEESELNAEDIVELTSSSFAAVARRASDFFCASAVAWLAFSSATPASLALFSAATLFSSA